jgi:hypothetical protein
LPGFPDPPVEHPEDPTPYEPGKFANRKAEQERHGSEVSAMSPIFGQVRENEEERPEEKKSNPGKTSLAVVHHIIGDERKGRVRSSNGLSEEIQS